MDSETVHGTVWSGVTSVPAGGPLFWRSADAGWKRQKHGDGLPGKGVTKKAAFITPGVRRLKGVYEICFF